MTTTAANSRRPAARGLDRLTLTVGLALVDWSHSRAARRALSSRSGRRVASRVDVELLERGRLGGEAPTMTRFR